MLLGEAAQVKGVAEERAAMFPAWALSISEPDPPKNPGVAYVAGSLQMVTVAGANFPVDQAVRLFERPAKPKLQRQALEEDPF